MYWISISIFTFPFFLSFATRLLAFAISVPGMRCASSQSRRCRERRSAASNHRPWYAVNVHKLQTKNANANSHYRCVEAGGKPSCRMGIEEDLCQGLGQVKWAEKRIPSDARLSIPFNFNTFRINLLHFGRSAHAHENPCQVKPQFCVLAEYIERIILVIGSVCSVFLMRLFRCYPRCHTIISSFRSSLFYPRKRTAKAAQAARTHTVPSLCLTKLNWFLVACCLRQSSFRAYVLRGRWWKSSIFLPSTKKKKEKTEAIL